MASSSTNEITSMTTRDGGRAGVVVLLQLGHDQQRRDLGLHRHVAGDEDHRAVLADARANASAKPVSSAGTSVGRIDPRRRSASGSRPRLAAASSTSRSRSCSTGCTVRTTNGRPMKISASDHAERRVGHLDAERLSRGPIQPFGGVERGERDAGHRRRQGERQIDQRIDQPPAGKR